MNNSGTKLLEKGKTLESFASVYAGVY